MKGGDDELKLIAYILLLHSTPKRLCPDVSICNLVTPGDPFRFLSYPIPTHDDVKSFPFHDSVFRLIVVQFERVPIMAAVVISSRAVVDSGVRCFDFGLERVLKGSKNSIRKS